MQNIEFLPRRFREQSLLRRRKVWRATVLLLFSSIVGVAAGFQHMVFRDVRDKLNEVRPQHTVAETTNQQLQDLQSELIRIQDRAGLYAWLGHPWPRTQVLAAIIKPLDSDMSLTSVQFQRQVRSQSLRAGTRPRRPRVTETETAAPGDPAQRDLASLRDKAEAEDTVVHVAGLTQDNAALHIYVANLGASRLFSKAELSSIETLDAARYDGTAQFNLRLVLAPAFGVKGGPTKALPKANADATFTSADTDPPTQGDSPVESGLPVATEPQVDASVETEPSVEVAPPVDAEIETKPPVET